MRNWMTWTVALAASLVIGCGEENVTNQTGAADGSHRLGPHRQLAYELPGGGLAEVATESIKGSMDPVVAVYFLQAAGKSPLSPVPSDVRVAIQGTEYSLTAQGGSGGKTGPARLASPPLPIDPDRVAGELKATINGAAFQTAFRIGQ